MARQNFKFDKRQKELAKQKKNEEKRLRKIEKRGDDGELIEGEVPEEVIVEETPAKPATDPNDPFADWTLDK